VTDPTAAGRWLRSEHRARAGIPAVILLVAIAVLTVVVATSVRRTAHDEARAEFQQSARQAALGVEDEMVRYFTAIEDVGALTSSVPAATPEQFRNFVQTARIFDRLPSIVAVFYLQRVTEADHDAFLARARAANPSFTPTPISTDGPLGWPRYYLMQYVPGHTDLVLPVGAEISPIKAITELLEVSARTGEGVVGSFQHDPVLQRIAEQMQQVPLQQLLSVDFFVGVPVYAPTPPGAPKGEPIGWTAAPVARFQEVVAQAARDTPQGLGVSLTVDLTDAGMAQRQDLSRVAQIEGSAGPRDRAAFHQDSDFVVGGATFHLSVWSTPTADDAPATVSIVLLGGLALALLAAAFLYLRIRANARERAFAVEMREWAQFQREIVDSVTSAMVVLDGGGRIVAANPAWNELLGDAPGDGDGDGDKDTDQRYVDIVRRRVPSGADDVVAGVDRVAAGEQGAVELDVPIESSTARRWFAVRATPLRGRKGGAVVVHTDITERKRSHDELEFKASRDNLTGLLNRAAFEAELDDALRHARADGTSAAVLFIDLDGFKSINDTYGHAVGDEVLRAVSTRIATAVRTTARVGRLGGDEFVVLIAPLASPPVANRTAERILRALEDPVTTAGETLRLAASVGIAVVDSPLGVSSTSAPGRWRSFRTGVCSASSAGCR
jgi:diguanylate cyclase (GGDEF)-like protein